MLAESPDRRIHIRNAGRLSVSGRSTVLFATDESWYLEVMGDGSRVRYHGNVDDPSEGVVAGEPARLDLATLERLGRAFIADRLARLIPTADDERLVFLGSRYRSAGPSPGRETRLRLVVSFPPVAPHLLQIRLLRRPLAPRLVRAAQAPFRPSA